jgi:antitoxin component of MazEF toxin-antitoxin module
MKTTAQKWGNSLAIRVPKRVAEEAGLREKDPVDIEVREGMLVVRPHLRRVYRLEDSSSASRLAMYTTNSTSVGLSVERHYNEQAVLCA